MDRFAAAVLSLLVLGCTAPTHPATAPPPPAKPTPQAAEPAPADDLARAINEGGYRIAFTVEGPPPSLFRIGSTIHAWIGHAAGGDAIALATLGATVTRGPAVSSGEFGLRDPIHEDAQLVALFARGDKRWVSIIESAPGSESRRVRLVEIEGSGHATVRATGEIGRVASIAPQPYDLAGGVAVVPLGASVYGVVHDEPLVLDGPGAELDRFAQHADPDCPQNKRCYPMPAFYDLRGLVGVAPDRSFVVANQGVLMRASARGTTGFRYETLATAGVVGNDHVTLGHLGEPPRVTRWTPPQPPPRSEIPPPPPGRSGTPQVPTGERVDLATGGVVALAENDAGALFAAGDDGILRQLDSGTSQTIFAPPAGTGVTAVVATNDRLAFVVTTTEPGRTPRHVVVIRD